MTILLVPLHFNSIGVIYMITGDITYQETNILFIDINFCGNSVKKSVYLYFITPYVLIPILDFIYFLSFFLSIIYNFCIYICCLYVQFFYRYQTFVWTDDFTSLSDGLDSCGSFRTTVEFVTRMGLRFFRLQDYNFLNRITYLKGAM